MNEFFAGILTPFLIEHSRVATFYCIEGIGGGYCAVACSVSSLAQPTVGPLLPSDKTDEAE